jgi:hypothetical protein
MHPVFIHPLPLASANGRIGIRNKRCEIFMEDAKMNVTAQFQISYLMGLKHPIALSVKTDGNG